jgi:hypothetical protein
LLARQLRAGRELAATDRLAEAIGYLLVNRTVAGWINRVRHTEP